MLRAPGPCRNKLGCSGAGGGFIGRRAGHESEPPIRRRVFPLPCRAGKGRPLELSPSALPSPGPPGSLWGASAGGGMARSQGRAVPAAAGVARRGTTGAQGPPVASPCSADATGSSPCPPAGTAGAAGKTRHFPAARPPSSLCSPISLSAFLPHAAHHVPGHQAGVFPGWQPGRATIWAGMSLRFTLCAPPSTPMGGCCSLLLAVFPRPYPAPLAVGAERAAPGER